ncbi:MAG: hypothetical protein ACU837_00785 [Gammaproteobacteria bacterium]
MNELPVCLADYEPLLPRISKLIDAEYELGTFSRIEEEFAASGMAKRKWLLTGKKGSICITLEKYEGYFFSIFKSDDDIFENGAELIREVYLMQGGNPQAWPYH